MVRGNKTLRDKNTKAGTPEAGNITERKRAEEALRESELFYRQMLESIPGMVFTTRPDGYCDYQNQQWVDFTGVPMIEHLGDGWNKLLHPDDRPRAFTAWCEAVEERAPYDLEYRVRRYDGAYEWFKVRGRPIRNEAGEIVRWFGTAVNIDQMLKAQEKLRQAKEEWELTFNSVPDLIAIIDERHRVVRVNRAMAERLGREPEECLGIPCYEAVHGSNLPPDFCPHSRTMVDSCEHNLELHGERLGGDFLVTTTPLLDREGKMTGTVHVARDITERKRAEVALKRAYDEMEKRVEERTAELRDKDQMLLLQSRQAAMGEMTGTLSWEGTSPIPRVSITICCEDGCSVVTIADSAGGIPEDIIDKVFDPYFTTKGPQQGTGVGLFMSKTIIEKNMGGRLSVRNRAGGAEFRIEVANDNTI